MNETISQLLQHSSKRKYTAQKIEETIVEQILRATQQSPTWINGQQMSIIRVTDIEKRSKLQELAGNQAYIGAAAEFWVFCLDFYRSAKACELEGKAFAIAENIDALIVGTTDVGIALGTAVVAAEAFGLGTVAIGGVRKDPQAVIELLELPSYVYPISGLCIGYPDEQPEVKPRLPLDAVVFENTYNVEITPAIQTYNDTYSEYVKHRTNGQTTSNWTSGIAAFYSEPFYRGNSYLDATPALQKQGFKVK
jgi:FMN reductase [NAD(P)H]